MILCYIGDPKYYEEDNDYDYLMGFDNQYKYLGMYDVENLNSNDKIYVFSTAQYNENFEKDISKYLDLAVIITKDEFLSQVIK